MEINHKKEAIVSKQSVSRFKVFRIAQPKLGNRYVMKITDTSDYHEGQIEVSEICFERDVFSIFV